MKFWITNELGNSFVLKTQDSSVNFKFILTAERNIFGKDVIWIHTRKKNLTLRNISKIETPKTMTSKMNSHASCSMTGGTLSLLRWVEFLNMRNAGLLSWRTKTNPSRIRDTPKMRPPQWHTYTFFCLTHLAQKDILAQKWICLHIFKLKIKETLINTALFTQ